jgi:hypothetical protein
VLGALEEGRVANARLTLVDAEGKERARFRRVDADFERTKSGGRSFQARLDGPGGTWNIAGEAREEADRGYRASLALTEAPVQDLVLLAGLSAIPATFNVKITGEAEAVLAGGRLHKLDLKLAGEPGAIQIHDKDTSPLAVRGVPRRGLLGRGAPGPRAAGGPVQGRGLGPEPVRRSGRRRGRGVAPFPPGTERHPLGRSGG